MLALNEGEVDRALRVLLGFVLLALGWGGVVAGTAGLLMKGLGMVPFLTGVIGWCPVYTLLGVDTLGARRPDAA